MRVCIIDRGPQFLIPPDQMPTLWNQFREWRERWRGKMESFEFFADGGGTGIVNVADENELQQMMLEYPFFGLDKLGVHVVIDGDTSLERWGQALEEMAGA
jgi:hypothetical protein